MILILCLESGQTKSSQNECQFLRYKLFTKLTTHCHCGPYYIY